MAAVVTHALGKTCPKCGSGEVFLSRSRKFGEEVLRTLTPIGFVRCQICSWRARSLSRYTLLDWFLRLWSRKWAVVVIVFFWIVWFLCVREVLRWRFLR
jgi:hypothetical protein